jgi:acyl carrier protein
MSKYQQIFVQLFNVNENQLVSLKYQDVPEWDSIGHMELMTALEEAYGIEIDIDDIIDFSSYSKGKEILKKYSIEEV